MHGLLDDLLVGAALLASVIYAVFSLGPRSLRGRLLTGASTLLRLLPVSLIPQAFAARLEAAAMSKAKGSCGGCDNCGSEQSPTPQLSAPEVGIPLRKIRKRR